MFFIEKSHFSNFMLFWYYNVFWQILTFFSLLWSIFKFPSKKTCDFPPKIGRLRVLQSFWKPRGFLGGIWSADGGLQPPILHMPRKKPHECAKKIEEPLITRFYCGYGTFPAEIGAFFLNHPTPITHLDTPQE